MTFIPQPPLTHGQVQVLRNAFKDLAPHHGREDALRVIASLIDPIHMRVNERTAADEAERALRLATLEERESRRRRTAANATAALRDQAGKRQAIVAKHARAARAAHPGWSINHIATRIMDEVTAELKVAELKDKGLGRRRLIDLIKSAIT